MRKPFYLPLDRLRRMNLAAVLKRLRSASRGQKHSSQLCKQTGKSAFTLKNDPPAPFTSDSLALRNITGCSGEYLLCRNYFSEWTKILMQVYRIINYYNYLNLYPVFIFRCSHFVFILLCACQLPAGVITFRY